MKKLALLSAFAFPAFSFAQITVYPAGSPSQVATFLSGNGVTISNVSIYGQPSQYGYFTAANTILGMSGGLVLTTGDTANVIGPNSSGQIAGIVGTNYSDSSIMSIEPTATYDVCMIEFDCVPSDDTLYFNYVFGSDEYPEYVTSQFNDAFGIFVTGGIYNDTNMALLPNGTPVSIANINNGFNNSGPCMNCAYYVNNIQFVTNLEYDGFTVNLTGVLPVVPNQTYHIKIIVADASDNFIDSGVFLQAGSFRCTNTAQDVPVNSSPVSLVSAYPIPATNSVSFNFTLLENPDVEMTVRSIDGKVVLQQTIVAHNNTVELDVSTLAEGAYIVEIIHDGICETILVPISEK